MIELGKYNELVACRETEHGFYLKDVDGQEVLLPGNSIPKGLNINDRIEVFIYNDSEDRVIATTLKPKITLGEFAQLKVKSVTKYGAFMDWGLQKDLLVPFNEQPRTLTEGDTPIVCLIHDTKSDRLFGSARIEKYLNNSSVTLLPGDIVDIMVYDSSELGYKVIINNMHKGLLFRNEVFQTLETGIKMQGYIKKIREDNKLDVSLHKFGYRNVAPNASKILHYLKDHKGQLHLTDRSTPEEIADIFGMSKKTFKKAIGDLYKKRVVRIEEDGIYLI